MTIYLQNDYDWKKKMMLQMLMKGAFMKFEQNMKVEQLEEARKYEELKLEKQRAYDESQQKRREGLLFTQKYDVTPDVTGVKTVTKYEPGAVDTGGLVGGDVDAAEGALQAVEVDEPIYQKDLFEWEGQKYYRRIQEPTEVKLEGRRIGYTLGGQFYKSTSAEEVTAEYNAKVAQMKLDVLDGLNETDKKKVLFNIETGLKPQKVGPDDYGNITIAWYNKNGELMKKDTFKGAGKTKDDPEGKKFKRLNWIEKILTNISEDYNVKRDFFGDPTGTPAQRASQLQAWQAEYSTLRARAEADPEGFPVEMADLERANAGILASHGYTAKQGEAANDVSKFTPDQAQKYAESVRAMYNKIKEDPKYKEKFGKGELKKDKVTGLYYLIDVTTKQKKYFFPQ